MPVFKFLSAAVLALVGLLVAAALATMATVIILFGIALCLVIP